MHPFIVEMFKDIFQVVSIPFTNPELLWQIAPILLMWFIIETYFGMHKHEELGWNTALSNGISLFWIIIGSMQYMFSNKAELFAWDKFGVILFVMIYAGFTIYVSFTHKISSKVTYVFSSPTAIYFLGYISFVYAYGKIDVDLPMISGVILLFLILLLFTYIYKKILPNKEKDDEMPEDKSTDFDKDFKSDFDFDKGLDNNKFDDASFNSTKSKVDDFKF